jgi:hypothetical protein
MLGDIERLAGRNPASVGDSANWNSTVKNVVENKVTYHKALTEKILFKTLYDIYAVTLNELKAVLGVSRQRGQFNNGKNDFTEVRRGKRQANDDTTYDPEKVATAPKRRMQAKVTKRFKLEIIPSPLFHPRWTRKPLA